MNTGLSYQEEKGLEATDREIQSAKAELDLEECAVAVANSLVNTDQPTLRLSANDAKMVQAATQIVFHKMPDGLFVEWFSNNEQIEHGVTHHLQANFSEVALQKLKEFINNNQQYEK